MVKRIAAIIFIFICTAAAWMILGGSVSTRTYDRGASLKGKVEQLWGDAQVQRAPVVSREEFYEVEVRDKRGNITKETRSRFKQINLDGSNIDVSFDLEHRKKGLLWYSTYRVNFSSKYTFSNGTGERRKYNILFEFPAYDGVYDNFKILYNGKPQTIVPTAEGIAIEKELDAGKSGILEVSYNTRGLGSWEYAFSDGGVATINDFKLEMNTDFKGIDFPEQTLSPTFKKETAEGWNLIWEYENLISGVRIGMVMPKKLNPGPLCAKITFFAPVSLLFFFFIMFMISVIKNIDIHPMNYFFLAAAFFAFHLLFAYLVDHLDVHLSFAVSAAVSVFLVISYLRPAVGLKFAFIEAGLSQLIYLILFSYAFFFEGYTGLSITIGAVITLFVAMQLTGRIDWTDKFKGNGKTQS